MVLGILRLPPSNRLDALRGDRSPQHSGVRHAGGGGRDAARQGAGGRAGEVDCAQDEGSGNAERDTSAGRLAGGDDGDAQPVGRPFRVLAKGFRVAAPRYFEKLIIHADRPFMKNLAVRPAVLSVPIPGSRPMTWGYHAPPDRIRCGGDQAAGSSRLCANDT